MFFEVSKRKNMIAFQWTLHFKAFSSECSLEDTRFRTITNWRKIKLKNYITDARPSGHSLIFTNLDMLFYFTMERNTCPQQHDPFYGRNEEINPSAIFFLVYFTALTITQEYEVVPKHYLILRHSIKSGIWSFGRSGTLKLLKAIFN